MLKASDDDPISYQISGSEPPWSFSNIFPLTRVQTSFGRFVLRHEGAECQVCVWGGAGGIGGESRPVTTVSVAKSRYVMVILVLIIMGVGCFQAEWQEIFAICQLSLFEMLVCFCFHELRRAMVPHASDCLQNL